MAEQDGYAALLARARDLVPGLRERAAETEALRRLPDATIADLQTTGLFHAYQPARFGGIEAPIHGFVELGAMLARGCGSTSWVFNNLASHNWMLGYWPPAAQEDVWGENPATLIGSGLIMSGGPRRQSGRRLSPRRPLALLQRHRCRALGDAGRAGRARERRPAAAASLPGAARGLHGHRHLARHGARRHRQQGRRRRRRLRARTSRACRVCRARRIASRQRRKSRAALSPAVVSAVLLRQCRNAARYRARRGRAVYRRRARCGRALFRPAARRIRHRAAPPRRGRDPDRCRRNLDAPGLRCCDGAGGGSIDCRRSRNGRAGAATGPLRRSWRRGRSIFCSPQPAAAPFS